MAGYRDESIGRDDYQDRLAAPPPATHHAGQWGLAALLLGCFLLVLFPVMLLAEFAGAAVAVQDRSMDESAFRFFTGGFVAVAYGLIGVAILALIFGVIGLISALVRGQPAGLSCAGTVMAVASLALHILLVIITHRVVEELRREKLGGRPLDFNRRF